MSLSPIGSAVFELLSRKHTYRQTYRYTSYYFRVRMYHEPKSYDYDMSRYVFVKIFCMHSLLHLASTLQYPYSKVI